MAICSTNFITGSEQHITKSLHWLSVLSFFIIRLSSCISWFYIHKIHKYNYNRLIHKIKLLTINMNRVLRGTINESKMEQIKSKIYPNIVKYSPPTFFTSCWKSPNDYWWSIPRGNAQNKLLQLLNYPFGSDLNVLQEMEWNDLMYSLALSGLKTRAVET